jgi:hypothetical protein
MRPATRARIHDHSSVLIPPVGDGSGPIDGRYREVGQGVVAEHDADDGPGGIVGPERRVRVRVVARPVHVNDARHDRQHDQNGGDGETAAADGAGHGDSENVPPPTVNRVLSPTRRLARRRRDAKEYSSTGPSATTDLTARDRGDLPSAGWKTAPPGRRGLGVGTRI